MLSRRRGLVESKFSFYPCLGRVVCETWTDTWCRRVDSSVLPLLFLGLLVFQLDRMNIASALTGGFAKDIKVDLDTINLGNQLLFMAIVIFEIPCNMALQKVGTTRNNWRLA